MKKIILVVMICLCLTSCMGNSRHKGGARMVKGCVDNAHPFVFLLERGGMFCEDFFVAKGG